MRYRQLLALAAVLAADLRRVLGVAEPAALPSNERARGEGVQPRRAGVRALDVDPVNVTPPVPPGVGCGGDGVRSLVEHRLVQEREEIVDGDELLEVARGEELLGPAPPMKV